MQVKPGDIFACDGSFYQTIKATTKTATIRPIERTFEGYADEYGWEKKFMPIPGSFTNDPWMGREKSEKGQRLKLHDFTRDKIRPELHMGHRTLIFWDGTPSVLDTYN
ncbi:hypothetical protein [Paratractidigestivibacter sp.]|uniref:hypothetical protein n=1 Tax=Paratractidigestivibacter sp. TaxID=2847316 RepID=UPI002AC909CD|nr:hypothetical protein [Paratractidigestivibacter sp.]